MTNKSLEMPFWDHLEELRWRLIKSIVVILIGAGITYRFSDTIMHWLIIPTESLYIDLNLQVLKITSMFTVKLSVALFGGIILGLPVILYQFWRFVAPGLKVNEKQYAFPVVFFAFSSFITGILFGYFILIPFSLEFFSGIGAAHVDNNFSIQYYFSFLTWILLGAGIIFQLPVVSLVLSAIGILTPPFMRHYRRHSVVVILILSSFITPPDPVSMVIMSFPLILLYEMSIGVSWLVNRRRT